MGIVGSMARFAFNQLTREKRPTQNPASSHGRNTSTVSAVSIQQSASRYQNSTVAVSALPQLYPMEILEIRQETHNAVSVIMKPRNGKILDYKPGQFLTLILNIEGEEYRRAYSFSSCPLDHDHVAVTVKRVEGGKVSNYLNENVKVGDVIQVMGPSGSFTLDSLEKTGNSFVFIGGGSGITPMVSLAETLLRQSESARIMLLYGNRSLKEIIFRKRLDQLAKQYAPRFSVVHVVEKPSKTFEGSTGLLTGNKILELVRNPTQHQYFICGPGPMMDGAETALKTAGVSEKDIKLERFSSPSNKAFAVPQESHSIQFKNSGIDVLPEVGETLLKAGLRAGAPLHYSCTMGGCGACKVKVIKGNAMMPEPNCLSKAEREKGYVLGCITYAGSELEIEG
ncbi:MAG: ferredoxin--NADP reductase [SAR324 cluster bacterium]|nr:ferredoxin--NADP reductase [SAR324 cluster bacterium]